MTVYVLRTGTRIRLGLAAGHSTTVLKIPEYLVEDVSAGRLRGPEAHAARAPEVHLLRG